MIPEAKIKRTKFSVIWLIPLIALITGLWMMYDNYSEKGTEITLEFKNGEGITENKTVIKYAGIKIGTVEDVKLSSNFDSVIVKAVIEKEYSHFAKEDSLFWLVKPRLEVGGISGIETIFSGQYIAVRPGEGQKKFRFKALENPPPSSQTAPGLHLVLEADDLGNLVPGSPVLYKKISVGKIESHSLSDNGEKVLVNILINPKYTHLVNKETRFWNVSGISVKGDLSGIKIDTGTLSSVIDGGVAFDTPQNEKKPEPADNNDKYKLYNNKEKAMEQGFLIKVEFDTGEGLVPGSTPVKYKGINIGKVIDVRADKTCKTITADILLKEKAKNAATENSKFWMVKPRLDLTGISGLRTIISGQYIEVQPGSGKPKTEFKALSAPPFSAPDAPGLHIILKADSADSLSEGSPVFTRGLEAGRVEGFEITDKGVNISVHIFAKYAKKVGTDSRFWNNSGFSVSGDLSGINLDAGNLQSIVSGAISFDTDSKIDKKADSGSVFRLYPDKEKAFATEKKIKVSFDNASGLKKGITPLKYKGIEVGKITEIRYNKNNDNFIAEINIYHSAPDLAKDGSVFFAVRPEINLSGVKGLETIIGGSYINVYKGNGKRKSSFKAKDSPPPVHPDLTGKKINLIADTVNSPNKGSFIFYKGFEAGIIQDAKIKKDQTIIKALIYDNFSAFLYTDTKFFKSGGIDFSADLSGVSIKTENLESIIKGGISFDEPEKSSKKAIENKTDFTLYKNREKAMEDGFLINLKLKSGYGIKENSTSIIYKGIKIGEIRDIKIDEDNYSVVAKTFIKNPAKSLLNENTSFILRGPEFGLDGIKRPETAITGKYIELIFSEGINFKDTFTLDTGKPSQNGLDITLEADALGSLSKGKPIYYRQVKVGEINGHELNNTLDKVLIYGTIYSKYSKIISKDAKFWYTGGISAKISLTGISVESNTLESILKGGIEFAVPKDKTDETVEKNHVFNLYKEPEKKWLEWIYDE